MLNSYDIMRVPYFALRANIFVFDIIYQMQVLLMNMTVGSVSRDFDTRRIDIVLTCNGGRSIAR